MIESHIQNRRPFILIFLCVLYFCTSACALAYDAAPFTNIRPDTAFYPSDETSTTLVAQADPTPEKTPVGNAYAYGHDKDKSPETPEPTPSSTLSATPSPTSTFTPAPTQTRIITPIATTIQVVTPVATIAQSPVSSPPANVVPLSGIIPDEALPAAAAGSAIALTGIFALFNSTISSWGGQIASFLKNAVGGIITGKILDRDKERRTIQSEKSEKLYFGFSQKELLVLLAGTLIIGILFLFADRQPLEPVMIAIYIIMGGFALVMHELAHVYFERKFSCRTEIQFWGIGTLIMALTAWLFGNVFAQPFLTQVHSSQPMEKRNLGYMMLSGPAVSVAIAALCLLLIPLGGLFRTAGMIGFIMNMVTAVFELLPIPPCEGKDIFTWNRLVWAAAFVPLFIVYLFMTM